MSKSSDSKPCPVVILISGSGSNLQSIIDKRQSFSPGLNICTVISNNPDAYGLHRAEEVNIPTAVINHRDYASRTEYDCALMAEIDQHQPSLVILAGFMRILTSEFVSHYADRLINIHPSLLPLYPGLNTHKKAIENNDTEAGATVHFVTQKLDGGPIIIQTRVPVKITDSPEQLAKRVLKQEHLIYTEAIQWFAQNRLSINNGKVLLDGNHSPTQQLNSDEM